MRCNCSRERRVWESSLHQQTDMGPSCLPSFLWFPTENSHLTAAQEQRLDSEDGGTALLVCISEDFTDLCVSPGLSTLGQRNFTSCVQAAMTGL